MGKQQSVCPGQDITNEVEMTLRTVNYPDVSLLEHLMTLDNVDAARLGVDAFLHKSVPALHPSSL